MNRKIAIRLWRCSVGILASLIVVASWLVFIPGEAFAQSDTQRARTHFEDGASLYYEGEYSRALIEFKRGHEIVPNGMFVYNIALCHIKLGRWEEALRNANQAQQLGDLDPRASVKNQARIAALHLRLESDEITTVVEAEQRAAQDSGEVAEVTTAEPKTKAASGLGTMGWLGVSGLVAGGVALSVALIFELIMQGELDEFDAAVEANELERARELESSISSKQGPAKILVFAGGGVAVLGAILLTVDLLSDSDTASSGVSIGLTESSFQVGWSF